MAIIIGPCELKVEKKRNLVEWTTIRYLAKVIKSIIGSEEKKQERSEEVAGVVIT